MSTSRISSAMKLKSRGLTRIFSHKSDYEGEVEVLRVEYPLHNYSSIQQHSIMMSFTRHTWLGCVLSWKSLGHYKSALAVESTVGMN